MGSIGRGWGVVKMSLKLFKKVGTYDIVGNGMVQPELGKVDAVKSFAVLETKTQVRAFLGLMGCVSFLIMQL